MPKKHKPYVIRTDEKGDPDRIRVNDPDRSKPDKVLWKDSKGSWRESEAKK